ncbi:hypothetical protein MXD61_05205 [Frankia sp. AgPm24]|uniref:hypothetical protein n=1 Tax=Frankia sp. AgPm24 TaxID=631128 RepID=UPI002010BA6C|nr:hypothetical protein [Frankia sp. AgPm24]MCK9921304.1 hypothetical protein [Frankia sp. AgPm24]
MTTPGRDSAPADTVGRTITVVVIPADPARPPRLATLDSVDTDTLRALAGGLEPVDLERAGAVLWTADTPLPASTALNARATALAAFHPRRFRLDQRIHGDAVLTGLTIHHDEVTLLDAPGLYRDLLTATGYQVQVRAPYSTGWIVLGEHHTSLAGAYQATRDVAHATLPRTRGRFLTARLTPHPASAAPGS